MSAVVDPERPDAPVRDLPHASIDGYAGDIGAAMLHVDGTGDNVAALAARVEGNATSGPVQTG